MRGKIIFPACVFSPTALVEISGVEVSAKKKRGVRFEPNSCNQGRGTKNERAKSLFALIKEKLVLKENLLA